MGQKQGKEKQQQQEIDKQVQLYFKEDEIYQARAVYNSLLNDKNHLDLELFSKLFENDLEFGVKLYKYLMKNKKTFKFIDYLLLGTLKIIKNRYQNIFNFQFSLDTFKRIKLKNTHSIISNWQSEQIHENHDINKITLSQEDVENVLYHLIMIYDIDNLESIMQSLKNRVSPYFDESSEYYLAYNNKRITLKEATALITKIFSSINQIIQIYFQNKLLHKQMYISVPNMNVQSIIMTEDFLSLLYMNNLYYQPSYNLTLLHQSSMDGMSMQTIINNLLGYNAQTLILLRSNLGVFGIFNNQPWLNQKECQGDDNCFIFSLKPSFNIFSVNHQSKNKNYVYMNSKSIKDYDKYQAGIGFGMSQDGSKYRLWLDQLVHSQSYIMFSDDIYEPGWIVEPKQYTKKDEKVFLSIDAIEIWGLGSQEHYENQQQRKIRNYNQQFLFISTKSFIQLFFNSSMRARVINKKLMYSLLSDFDKQIFFSKIIKDFYKFLIIIKFIIQGQTFQHINQVREDICCPADLVEEQHRLTREQLKNVQFVRTYEES